MRDIPVFTTENGVASLFLKKIPYTREAFVHIRDSQACDALVRECMDVCRMAGAEIIYATGHDGLIKYPLVCDVSSYCVPKDQLPKTDAIALPVTLEQKDWWRTLYNQKMGKVHGAAPLSVAEVEELICDKKALCVYKECAVMGIGVINDGEIQAVASIVPGAGRAVVLALASCLEDAIISLSVSSINVKAINLYRSLGFEKSALQANWYQIL